MTHLTNKTAFAAALVLTASVGLALPASAATTDQDSSGSLYARIHHVRAARNDWHRSARSAYRDGYRQGFRDGHYARATPVAGDGVLTGRSVAVDPTTGGPLQDGGILGTGGVLGTGVLGGNGVLGTGVLNGQGALGIGVLGF